MCWQGAHCGRRDSRSCLSRSWTRAGRARHFERAAGSYAKASRLEAEIGARMLERLDYSQARAAPHSRRGQRPAATRARQALPRRRRARAGFFARHAAAGEEKVVRKKPVRAIGGDLARLPLARASVELVWSNMALHWAADPLAAIREFHRVLAVEAC
jgi:malonyl-CoA O-methyltransferase